MLNYEKNLRITSPKDKKNAGNTINARLFIPVVLGNALISFFIRH